MPAHNAGLMSKAANAITGYLLEPPLAARGRPALGEVPAGGSRTGCPPELRCGSRQLPFSCVRGRRIRQNDARASFSQNGPFPSSRADEPLRVRRIVASAFDQCLESDHLPRCVGFEPPSKEGFGEPSPWTLEHEHLSVGYDRAVCRLIALEGPFELPEPAGGTSDG